MDTAVLANIQTGQMEAKQFNLGNQVIEGPARNTTSPQTGLNQVQINQKRRRITIATVVGDKLR